MAITKKSTLLFSLAMFFYLLPQTVAAAVGNSKLVTGTQELLSDLTNVLIVVAPIAAVLCIVYFFIRRASADEVDQKIWNNRITTAIVSCIGAVVVSATLSLILNYYK
jgi:purine-cytosine permease-like protein